MIVKPAHSVIVGGGYIGLEMAEALRAERCRRDSGGALLAGYGAGRPRNGGSASSASAAPRRGPAAGDIGYGIRRCRRQLQAQLSTGESVDCGIAILAVGVKPEVKLAKEAGLVIGERGGIAVDEHMRTSDPDIFAVGDAVEVTDFVGGFADPGSSRGAGKSAGPHSRGQRPGQGHASTRTPRGPASAKFSIWPSE